MPATYAHGVYGKNVLNVLDEKTKALIQKYRNLYDIGCSGPDILFFYRPLKFNAIRKLGDDIHHVPARDFFMRARTLIRTSSNPDAALVYVLGFINHFVLDSECHPKVSQDERDTGVTHSEIESELDALLMREDGLDPIRTRACDHIVFNHQDCKIIAPFFGLTPNEIKESMNTMKLFLNFFVAPSEIKRKFIFGVMKKVNMYDHYHGLIFNREVNPISAPTCAWLREHMDLAVEASVRLINEYQKTLETEEILDERYDRTYE